MSLLDQCPGGSLLEKPKAIVRPPQPGAADALRARILDDCLPAQRAFLDDEQHRILSYIGGFGSGKSFALAAKLIFLGLRNPGGTLMACEPTFPMIRTVLVPAIDMALDQWEIEYSFRASPQPEYTISLPTGPVTIYCQSAENYQRIRGQNICAAVWDECDTSPVDTAQKAGEMLLARMRTGELNQLAVASTPEGFRWAYRTFVEISAELRPELCRYRRGDEFHFFAEKVYRDTQQIAQGLKEMYPHHFNTGQLILIPDAASKQRATAAAQESDIGILKRAGHQVKVQNSNPVIADRINAVNALVEQRKIKVGNGCKHLIRTFEQHAYDEKGKPEKGGVGMDDLSHAGDAAGYAIYKLAAIRQWKVGSGKSRSAQIW